MLVGCGRGVGVRARAGSRPPQPGLRRRTRHRGCARADSAHVDAGRQDGFRCAFRDEQPTADGIVDEHRRHSAIMVEGTFASRRTPPRDTAVASGASQSATSRGLPPTALPSSTVASLQSKPSRNTSSSGLPVGSTARTKLMWPSVSVPVLSVRRISMSPRSSMHTRRLTSTPCRARRRDPVGQTRGHDRREQLRRDAHGDRQREQERFEQRPLQEQVDHEDRRGQDSGDLDEQHRELPQARLELGDLLSFAQPRRDLAELGASTGADHDRLRRRRCSRRCP